MIRYLLRSLACLAIVAAAWSADQIWDGGSGANDDWSTNQNWGNNNEPNGSSDGATMVASPRLTPNLDVAVTLNRLTFTSGTYVIGGASTLTMDGSNPLIEVLSGSQTLSCQFALTGDVTVYIATGASLTISDPAISGTGRLVKVGGGTLTVTDNAAPAAPGWTLPAVALQLTSDTTPTWTWTTVGSGVFRYRLSTTGPWTDTTANSFTPAASLGDGNQVLEVQAYGRTGALSTTASRSYTIDGTPPTILSRKTLDLNTDGFIDTIEVTFSENMDTNATQIGTWTVAGYTTTGTSTWNGGTRLRVGITPKTSADTGAIPSVRHVAPGTSADIRDVAGNLLPTESAGSIANDGAGPVIVRVDATAGATQVTVVLSEPVTNGSGGNLDFSDFTYANPGASGVASLIGNTDVNGNDGSVSFTTNVAITATDLFPATPADTVAPKPANVKDLSGNSAIATAVQLRTPTPQFSSVVGGGDWSTPATWVANRVPVDTDDVLIVGPVTLIKGGYGDCSTITFSGAGSLSCAAGGVPGTSEYCLIRIFGGNNQITALDDTIVTEVNFWDRSNFGATYDITFTVAAASTLTLNNSIQGQWARTVNKRGAGTLVWNAPAATYSPAWDDGPTRIEAGTFRLLVADGRPPGFEMQVASGATLDLRVSQAVSSLTGQGTVTRGAAGTSLLTIAGSTWGGSIQNGAGTMQVSASGTNTWGGPNTFTGGLSLTGGTISVSGTSAIADACPVTVASGATLTVAAAETVGPLNGAGAISLNAALTVNHAATAASFTGTTSGTGGFTVIGSGGGSLTLSGANLHTGGTIIGAGGRLIVSTNTAIGAPAGGLTLDGGALSLSGHVNMTGSNLAYNNIGTGPSAAFPSSTPFLAQGGVSRPVTITANDGTIELNAFSLAVPGFDTAVGQDLSVVGNGTAAVNATDPAMFVVVPSGTTTWAGRLTTTSAFGFLCKRGAGRMAITNGGNTWTKNVVRGEEGEIAFGASGSLGTVVNWVFILPGATGRLDDLVYASAPTLFISGTLGVGGTSSWQGPVNLWSSTPVIDVAAAGKLTLTGSVSSSGAASVTKTGAGSLVMAASNTFVCPITVSGGSLVVDGDDRLGNATNTLALNGGTLAATTGFPTARAINLGAGNGTIDVASGQNLTVSGTITGSGLAKTGSGDMTLSGTLNSYTGGTTISDGAVVISTAANLGSSTSPLTFAGGTLRSVASIDLGTRAVTVNAAGGIVDATSGVLLLQGVVSGSGKLVKSSAGTLALSGANNLTGNISVAGGTLSARSALALGSVAGNTSVANGATLELNGTFTSPEPLQLTGGGVGSVLGVINSVAGTQTLSGPISLVQSAVPATVAVAGGGTTTITGTVSGGGGLSKIGTGTLGLTSPNAFTGDVQVTAGVLQLDGDDRLGAPSNQLVLNGGILRATGNIIAPARILRIGSAGGTLQANTFGITLPGVDTAADQQLTLSGPGSVTFNTNAFRTIAGVLAGDATMVKAGSGTLALNNAANTFTGPTSIDAGQLAVSGNLAGTVSVAATASLSGTGTVGATTIAAGGILSPGGNAAGVINLASLDMQAGAVLAANLGSASDLVSVAGTATVRGGLAYTIGAGFIDGTYVLINAAGGVIYTAGDMVLSPDPTPPPRYSITADATKLLLTRDGAAPTITAITSASPDGSYVSGQNVDVRVVLSEPVILAGGLVLTLNTTPSAATLTIPPSAVRSSEFAGTYTVVAPQVAADLTVTAIAFQAAGSFTDAVGNVLSGALAPPTQNLGNLKNIAIVNQAPQVEINESGVGTTTPPAYDLSAAGASVLFADPVAAGKLAVIAIDPEAATPLTWTLRLDPSVGQLERFNTISSAWVPVSTTGSATFTQDEVQLAHVRYRHTGSVGGNDAILLDCQDPQGNTSPLFLVRFRIAGNGPPVVSQFDGETFDYLEPAIKPGLFVAIDGDIAITSTRTSFTGGTLTISVLNGTSDDQLDVIAPATVAGTTVSLSGTPVATVLGRGDNALTFSLLGGATPATTAALVKAVGYRHIQDAPSTAIARSLSLAITDGSGTSGTTTVVKSIAFDLYNDPPVVDGTDVATIPGLQRSGSVVATDPEGQSSGSLVFSVVQGPSLGTLNFNLATGTYTYQANQLPSGTTDNLVFDSFIIGATDQAFAGGDPRRIASPTDAARTAARIGTHTVNVRITSSAAGGVTFRNVPRMTVNTGGIFAFTPQVTAPTGANLVYELIQDPGVTGFNTGTGIINWNPVPAPGAGGYHRFGLLVTDTVSGVSAYLPIMLRVGPGGTG